jgi:hypothetical protein
MGLNIRIPIVIVRNSVELEQSGVSGEEGDLYENTQGVQKMVMNMNMDIKISRNHTGSTRLRLGSSMRTGYFAGNEISSS